MGRMGSERTCPEAARPLPCVLHKYTCGVRKVLSFDGPSSLDLLEVLDVIHTPPTALHSRPPQENP